MSAPVDARTPGSRGSAEAEAAGPARARRGGGAARPRPDLAEISADEVSGVYGFFASQGAGRQDAEDLTQATFERAVRAWSRYDPSRASVKTWLFAIARNVLIDHYRRERTRRRATAAGEVLKAPEAPAGDLERSLRLEEALSELSPREREVLALRFAGELDCAQIAAILSLSHSNVQQICSRALRKLRAQLQEPAAQPPAPGKRP